MTLRILHTADLHLGMKFTRRYIPEVQERLIEARFETFEFFD
jgi:DNA repair exonuclease SbcCD nuclease subunit